jgi:hypothetical protein
MEDINTSLDTAIREKNLEKIRDILVTSMVQDPGFSKDVFAQRLYRCAAAGISEKDIFVPFEGEPLNENSGAWTADYYAAQRVEFRYNFSQKRLEHLKKVGAKLFPAASSSTTGGGTRPTEQSDPGSGGYGGQRGAGQADNNRDGNLPPWLIPAAIGAAVLAIIAILLFG